MNGSNDVLIERPGLKSGHYASRAGGKLSSYNNQTIKNQQKNTINKLLKTEKEVFVISIKGPIDQSCFEGLKNYACLYEYTPNSIRTIVKQLKKEISFNGQLPK